jgi:hypothetical protein
LALYPCPTQPAVTHRHRRWRLRIRVRQPCVTAALTKVAGQQKPLIIYTVLPGQRAAQRPGPGIPPLPDGLSMCILSTLKVALRRSNGGRPRQDILRDTEVIAHADTAQAVDIKEMVPPTLFRVILRAIRLPASNAKILSLPEQTLTSLTMYTKLRGRMATASQHLVVKGALTPSCTTPVGGSSAGDGA